MLTPSAKASPHHDIAAANLEVIQNDTGNTTASVTVTAPLSINDFRVADGSIRGTFHVQIGDDINDDALTGVLIDSIRQNGRDNGETSASRKGINYGFPNIGTNTTASGYPENGYLMVAFADSTTTTNVVARYNFNMAGAWFPSSTWMCGHIYNAEQLNGNYGAGATNDFIRGTAGLSIPDNYYETAGGTGVLDLTPFGIDSRTDGVLLVCGGKNEDNWATSSPNPDDGTWDVKVKGGNDNGGGTEQDPVAFVFIPRTNTSVVSGSFLGDGSISVYSGVLPQFTVSSNSVGTYELKIPGYNPTNGVLIVAPSMDGTVNVDNEVTYQANAANDGWIIQSRDFPGINSPLEAIPATETVANFVFIPADNDLPNLVVAPATLSVVEGQTNSYTIELNSQPVNDVTVNVTCDSAQATISPSSVTFNSSDWNVPKTISVIGTEDLISEGSIRFNITNSISSTDPVYSTVVSAIVLATTLDNEPVISLPSGGAVYTVGSSSVGIDGRATIDDVNTTNYEGTTMTVTITANGDADDRLEIRNTGTGAGQISVSGNTVSYEGSAFATFAGGVGTSPLSITFDGGSNPTNAQALLQSITYHSVNASPNAALRSVSVVVTHPDNGSGAATTTIQLGLLNIVNFQQNVDSGYGLYTNEADIEIHKSDPDLGFPSGRSALARLFIDYPTPGGNGSQVLLRFDNIFGNGPGQIPADAHIVSADLYLHVIDNGDGSPLYRMLIPFDDQNETWNLVGGGVDQDDVESRSAYDSVIGLTYTTLGTNNSPNTGLGTIATSVLTDILAWQNGEANYGWVLPGSVLQTDGTGISPGEDPNPANRPRLSIKWVPASASVATFRQGVNGYTGAKDTHIRANNPDFDGSLDTPVFVDWAVTAGSTENDEQVLIRFDDIIGTGSGQIPPNAVISAAILDINSTDLGNAMGDGGTFHSMLISWDQTNTWNSFNNGISADDVEAVQATTASAGNPTLNPNVEASFLTFDLTSDVQAWVSGTRPNYGWVILPWPNGGDGWGFDTSDAANEIQRPQLRVYYTPGPAIISIKTINRTATDVTITFGGEVGTTYSVRRASTVDGTYSVVGSATVQEDGTATFTDNSPPAGAAFYRISNP
jgi:hypothetical protein